MGFTPYISRDILLPVVTAMEMKGGLAPIVLSDHPRGRPDGTARSFHSVSRHWTNDTAQDAKHIAGAVHTAFRTLARSPGYRRVFSDGGQSLWPSARENIMDLGLYAQHEISRYAASARHFLSHHRPAVVVSPDVADARTRAFTLLAAQCGVPTVEVQFGACGPEATEWRFFEADRAAVWGTQSWQVLVSHGVPADRVVVTGSPRHDVLFEATSADVREFRDRFRIPSGNVAVVFGSTSSTMSAYDNAGDNATLREMKRAIFAAAATFPNLTLIVKPHPLENVDETRALSAGAANVVFADSAEDIRGLSRVCEAFITFGSASTLDALILGKPTVCPSFPGWRWNDLFVDTGAVAVPRTYGEIEAAIRDLAEHSGTGILAAHAGAREAFLVEWVRAGGHGGVKQVIELLESVARGNGRDVQ
ncbi:MAG: CDP-glycerol glycerophosphotransferase family protein [Gemmatimonadaceae bacterium]|nr:CDP-glycerol glycerophosphotransferase family protein [Gemmatimonadaceae bacterium]